MAYESNIIPTQRSFAVTLKNSLLSEYETDLRRHRIGFDLSQVRVLQEDENRRAERFANLVKSGVITVATAKQEMGMEALPGDDVYLRSIATVEVPAGQIRPMPTPIGQRGLKGSKQDHEPSELQLRMIEMIDREHESLSSVFQGELEKFFGELGRAAYAATRDVIKGHGPFESKVETEEIIRRMDLEGWQAQFNDMGGMHYLRVTQSSFLNVGTILGVGIDLPNELEPAIIRNGGTRLGLVDLSKQTRANMFSEIAAAREAGEGPLVIARRIRDSVGAGPWRTAAMRAQVIARTETKNAQREAVLSAYQRSGVVQTVIVFDARLGDTDADCEYWNGQEVSFEQARNLAASEHPNGTRDFAPVIN